MKGKIVFLCTLILIFSLSSFAVAQCKFDTDYPAFYRAAKIILDPSTPNTQVYEASDPTNPYNIPERYVPYRYSMAVAYLLSPLGLLPYVASKTIFEMLNILAYFLAIGIILRRYKVEEKYMIRFMAFSFLWIPFLRNFSFVQVNSFMLLAITLAVFAAKDNHPAWCGVLLGLMSLIRFSPIAIAMVLGLKNWRIFAACAVTFSLALFFPETKEWIASFSYPPFPDWAYSGIYKVFGNKIFFIFSFIVAASTGLFTLLNRNQDYETLTAVAIPAAMLASPIVEMFHATVIMFSLSCFYGNYSKSPKWVIAALSVSILLMTLGSFKSDTNIFNFSMLAGLFIMWVGTMVFATSNRLSYCVTLNQPK